MDAPNIPHRPTVGLLTRTLSDSPVVKWVLPLGLHRNLLYIGEDYIHHYETSAFGGYVSHVESLSRFESRILAAAMMRNDKSSIMGDLDQDQDQDQNHDPGVLLLTLENSTLLLIGFRKAGGRLVAEPVGSYALPRTQNPLQKIGKLLAVEQDSRAIAVAAPERGLLLFNVTSSSGRVSLDLSPTILDHAHILHMDFLHMQSLPASPVTLLLVKLISQKIMVQRIEWSTRDWNAMPKIHDTQRISLDGALPNLLIPLKHSASFILAASTGLFLSRHILTGHAEQQKIHLPDLPHVTNRAAGLLWTSWVAHPTLDSVIVFRNDGFVVRLDVSAYSAGNGNGIAVSFLSDPGMLMPDFRAAHWLSPADDQDVVVLHGSAGEGGVYKVFTKQEPGTENGTLIFDRIQELPSWATALDLVCTNLWSLNKRQLRPTDGLFITSNTANGAQVTELRPGIEAHLVCAFDLGSNQIRSNLWTTPFINDGQNKVFLLSEYDTGTAVGTKAIWFDGDGVEVVDYQHVRVDSEIRDELSGLDLTSSTLHVAAHHASGGIIQATRKTVRRTVGLSSEAETMFSVNGDGTEIVAVDVMDTTDGQEAIIMTSHDPSIGSTNVNWHCLSFQNPARVQSLPFTGYPTAVKIFSWKSQIYYAFATSEGQLLVKTSDAESQPVKHKFNHNADMVTTAEAIAVTPSYLVSNEEDVPPRMLCSLRNGTIEVLSLGLKGGTPHIILVETITLGVTSVIMTPMLAHANGSARCEYLAACGSNLYAITIHLTSDHSKVEQLWITDRDEPSFQHENVSAILQVRHHLNMAGNDLYGALVVVMGSRFLIASLQQQTSHAVPRSVVPRQNTRPSLPLRLMYSARLSHFVSAAIEIHHVSNTAEDGQYYRSILEYHPPRASVSDDLAEGPMQALFNSGERIYALCEWVLDRDDKEYVFTLVGTGITSGTSSSGPATTKGRMHILRPTLRKRRVTDVRFTGCLKFDHSVYTLAIWCNHLLVGHGTYLSVYDYSPENRKWIAKCTLRLGSPAVYIQKSINPPLIHVSTAGNSLATFRLTYTESGDVALRLVASDSVAIPCLHHLTVPWPAWDSTAQLHLVATKTAQIRGLLSGAPVGITSPQEAKCLFTTRLPRSLTRLANVNTSLDPMVEKSSIVGLATDGALYGLALLSAHEWARLKVVECLIRQDAVLGRFLTNSNERGVLVGLKGLGRYEGETAAQWEARTGFDVVDRDEQGDVRMADASEGLSLVARPAGLEAEDMHVDGDVLGRLMDGEHGPEITLARVLRTAANGEDRLGRFVAERLEEELELVHEVVGLVRHVLKGWGFW